MEDHYIFPCPVYRTQIREGEILPTGHSTNFIFQLGMLLNKIAIFGQVRTKKKSNFFVQPDLDFEKVFRLVFISNLDLPSDQPAEHWIKRGVGIIMEFCETQKQKNLFIQKILYHTYVK